MQFVEIRVNLSWFAELNGILNGNILGHTCMFGLFAKI